MHRRIVRAAAGVLAVASCSAAATFFAGCKTPSDQSIVSQANTQNAQLAPAIITDPQVTAYMQQIGSRIVAAAKQLNDEHKGPASHFASDSSWMFAGNVQFHLVNSKTLNAFTTGGNHVYVYLALLNLCDREEDLAAVMSHEFGHIYSRHVQQGERRQTMSQVAVLGAVGGAYLAGGSANGSSYASATSSVAPSVAQFVGMGFTRGDEKQADDVGFQIYTRAGWQPQEFPDFFQKMIDAGYDTTPAIASDHPTLASRVADAKSEIAKLPATNPHARPTFSTPQQFAAFKQHADQIAANTPTDASLQKSQQLLAGFASCVAPLDAQPEQVAVRKKVAEQQGQ